MPAITRRRPPPSSAARSLACHPSISGSNPGAGTGGAPPVTSGRPPALHRLRILAVPAFHMPSSGDTRANRGKEADMAVVALEISRREPVLAGAAFGAAGAYEKLSGVIRFAVDPAHPTHGVIADLDRAPRIARGLVESWADFYLLRPVGGGRRRLLLDIPNRGRKMAIGLFNSVARSNDPSTPEDFGNGFLMRQGWTVAWVGWQTDVPRE